jgi:Zn finger protein HypA/HybF involved in hydrogenase expression
LDLPRLPPGLRRTTQSQERGDCTVKVEMDDIVPSFTCDACPSVWMRFAPSTFPLCPTCGSVMVEFHDTKRVNLERVMGPESDWHLIPGWNATYQ